MSDYVDVHDDEAVLFTDAVSMIHCRCGKLFKSELDAQVRESVL